MPVTIPEFITVHLGTPSGNAENVTVPFPEYVRNVASSEIYPTWPESALRANIYAQVSFALNRIYTEWYRSQGYDFDITSSTAYDQSFVPNREIFDNVAQIADELFDDYLRRPGADEPLFAQYCSGTTVTCDGLSQWGSVRLANQGKAPYGILTEYYGSELDIVRDAPVASPVPSFRRPLAIGAVGDDVRRLQVQLNRVSQNYPAIPKVPTDGIYGGRTFDGVRKLQEIFALTQTGAADRATWYRLAYLYVTVKRLAELYSEGERLLGEPVAFDRILAEGDRGSRVRLLQYYLAVIATFFDQIAPQTIDGRFEPLTRENVASFQRLRGLDETGTVDAATWEALSTESDRLAMSVPPAAFSTGVQPYPGFVLTPGMRSEFVAVLQNYLIRIAPVYDLPAPSLTGYFGSQTKAAVTAFQRRFGLTPDGVVGAAAWNALVRAFDDAVSGDAPAPGQNPGRTLREGDRDDSAGFN